MQKMKKLLTLFLTCAMVLSLLPIHQTAAAADLADTAYAVLEDNGTLTFFRSEESYAAGPDQAVTDIEGNTYTGTVYTDIETTQYSYTVHPKWFADSYKIRAARAVQTVAPVSTAYWFSTCTYLKNADLDLLDTSLVTSMEGMFQFCSGLSKLDLNAWDTCNVTHMADMFSSCHGLTTLNVNGWNTSNVEDMNYMFFGCNSLTTLDVSGWDTSNVTDMCDMFFGCSRLVELDLSQWDTSSVIKAERMFQSCLHLTEIDVSKWNTSNITSTHRMFYNCQGITTLDVSQWDTSNVTDMSEMFSGCKNLTMLDVSCWDTSNVTYMHDMFGGCNRLIKLDVSDWNTSNVKNMRQMFGGCDSLTELALPANFIPQNMYVQDRPQLPDQLIMVKVGNSKVARPVDTSDVDNRYILTSPEKKVFVQADTFTGVRDGYCYQNGVLNTGAGMVEYDGKLYYSRIDGSVYANGKLTVTEAKANGLVAPGTYFFGADGAALNGLVNGYYYENGVLAKGKGMIEYEGELYFIRTNGSIYTDGKLKVTEEQTNGLVTPGVYCFDGDGTFLTGLFNGYYYEDGVLTKGKGMIEYEGQLYYIRTNGRIYTDDRLKVTEEKANGLITPGTYFFDENGVLAQ